MLVYWECRLRRLSAFHALHDGRRKVNGAHLRVSATFHLNRNAVGFWKRIGNDFEFLSIQTHLSRNGVAEMLDPVTYVNH